MNKTKFWLILFAAVFTLFDIGWNIYDIVIFFMTEPQNRAVVFYVIYYFIEIFALIVVAVLLTLSIWGKGKYFRRRYGYYMTSLVISLIVSLFSVSSILLIISMFVSDMVWIHPEKEKTTGNVVSIIDTKEEKIAKLRRKRDNGEITEQQFQEEIMKLL